MKTSNQAFLLIILAALFGSSVPVAAKIAYQSFTPFTLVFCRFLIAALFLVPFVYRKIDLHKSKIKKLILVGSVGSLNPIFLFIALQFTKASVTPLIYASVPALSVLILYLFENKRISFQKILSIGVGLFGVALVVLEPVLVGAVPIGNLIGNSLIFLAAIAFACFGILSKKISKTTPIELTLSFILMTLILSSPLMLWEIYFNGLPQILSIKPWIAAVYVGVGGTALFYLSFQKALAVGNAITASLFTYLQPIFTALLAILLLGEKVTVLMVVGGLIAFIGARLGTQN